MIEDGEWMHLGFDGSIKLNRVSLGYEHTAKRLKLDEKKSPINRINLYKYKLNFVLMGTVFALMRSLLFFR